MARARSGEPTTAPRDYVVGLREGDTVSIKAIVSARSSTQAKDAVRDGQGGRWVAVPARNWNEEDLSVETKTVTRRSRVAPGQTSLSVPGEAEPS